MELNSTVPKSPVHKPTLLWQHAPWSHIKGAVTRGSKDWDSDNSLSVDEAKKSLDEILGGVITKYVKVSKPKRPGPVVWWNDSCQEAYDDKLKLFGVRFEKPVRYNAATNHCRTVRNRAFAMYQKELSMRLESIKKCDKKFWQLTKEIGGIGASRPGVAPSAEAPVEHFATKMSNGKDQEDTSFESKGSNAIPLCAWKIRRKRVKKVLSSIDASKCG